MADIRCPMCGKSNPDHLDVCQFCEARIKPLIAPDSGDDIFGFQEDAEEESLPDWFEASPEGEDSTPFEDNADDWLTRLGGDSEPGDVQIDQSRAAARMDFDDNGVPDWLEDLDEDRSTPPLEDTEEGVPTWLSADDDDEDDSIDDGGLPDWLIADNDQSQASDEQVPELESESLDWLSDFEEPSPIESTLDSTVQESELPLTDDGDLPDWLFEESESAEPVTPDSEAEQGDRPSQFVSQDTIPLQDDASGEEDLLGWLESESPESDEPAAKGDIPDWLADMEEPEPSKEGAPALATDESDLPDWLKGGEVESAEPAAEGDMPDWLAEMEEPAPSEEVAPALATDRDDLPDWLASTESESAEPAAEGDMPEWLADMDEPALPEEAAPAFDADDSELLGWLSVSDEIVDSEGVEPAVEGELPAWLSDMDEPASLEEAVSTVEAGEGDLPDWLAGEETGSTEPADEGDMPDWLVGAAGVAATAAAAASLGDDEEELPAWLAETEDTFDGAEIVDGDEELPDWLAGMDGLSVLPEEESEPSLPAEVVNDSRAVPDWLREMEGVDLADEEIISEAEPASEPAAAAPFVVDEEFEDDLFAMDQLPDWGADQQLPEGDQIRDLESQPNEADLAPAELPGWLAAMRPLESGAESAEERGPIETSGPLAGLHSILAAEPDVLRLKKPPTYSSKLQVSDAQQSHAVLLQELLGVEKKPRELPHPALISSQRVFKAVLGAILVLIAFLIVAAGTEMTPMPGPETIPDSIKQTSQLIEALSLTDTVLLAFDYEPGLAGEMEASAAAVVDHMMLRGAKLALVSTSPTGPALAERFINHVQSDHNYMSGPQYVNLGFIPGGVSGLASFARNPQWVAPNTLDGVLAWNTEPLQNVKGLSDFGLIVLITDNPNTARAWIEQVQPQANNVPMVAVVSAQVEPMIRPYYDNQQAQLSGLISGLTGGAVYEVVSRNNLARTYWDAFNIVLIVAVSAIFISIAVTMISDLLARRRESGGESA